MFKASFWPQILLKNKFWDLGEKSIPKQLYVSFFKKQKKVLHLSYKRAMAACKRAIVRALLGLFLTISEHTF